ncbi:MAG TPA: hypothetical protein RMG45_19940 [Polyangiaceae bacterium LLY-WYZ-15_(1-7)]|nr:hypothetical protein [Polyangiaceae bacterium LLY-WYZ-15_(1-7)]
MELAKWIAARNPVQPRQLACCLQARPDPAYDAPGELELFPENVFTAQLEPLSGRWESRGFDDQIGWAAPDGVRALVEVEARGVDWARRAEVAVRVVDSDGWDECDVVPRQSRFGCELQLVEGAMAITAIDAPPGFACGDEVAVTVALTPTDPIPEGCVELERTLTLERGCVDAQSLEVGATLDARWELGLTDACPPDTFGLQLEGCACE